MTQDVWALVLPVTPATLYVAAKMVGGYLLLMFLGARFLPALERKGYAEIKSSPTADADEAPLDYNLTGLTLFVWTHLVVAVLVIGFGWSLTPIITHFWSLFVVTNIVAFALTIALWIWGRRSPDVVAADMDSGLPLPKMVEALWFGNELNPRWLGVDLKMFLYQPSLIGVGLIVAAFAFAQYDLTGTLTPQMLCFQAFWWVYLWTHYVKEEFMLSTWDIIAENLGFMLVWGDLVYVPFLYSLPGWFVLANAEPFPTWAWVSLAAACLVLMAVFRDANWQKERFKRNPMAPIWGGPAEALDGRLLVSGWWGVGRKINYAGEIGVYTCMALCAGLNSFIPFIVPLSLVILLVQRASRDDERCRQKYGPLWVEYCQRVPYRLLPFIY